jgi:hypothetical protein
MKKKHIGLFLISFFIFISINMRNSTKMNDFQIDLSQNSKKNQKKEFLLNKVSIGNNISGFKQNVEKDRKPSSRKKVSSHLYAELDTFEKVQLPLFGNNIFLVEGIYAYLEPQPNLVKVSSLGGFFIYESKHINSFNVIYDKQKNEYGVFTGEVILKGAYVQVISFIKKSDFDIVYENELLQQVNLKIESLDDLSLLENLKSISNMSIVLDLKYSRAKQM